MPSKSSTDPTLGTASAVGKYFSVVSTVPATLLAGWLYILLASGAFSSPPSLDALRANNPIAHPEYIVYVTLFAIAFALVTHPLQFALVQWFEGYWGAGALARKLGPRLALRHLRLIARVDEQRTEARKRRGTLPVPPGGDLNEYLGWRMLARDPELARVLVHSQAQLDALGALSARYPQQRLAVLPTRLGNTLRRHELLAGAAVHLSILDWATHIGMVAEPRHTAYVNDQRVQLDLAVRTAAVMLLAAAATFALLWHYGFPVLLTLIPYSAAYLSYRGAVVSADSYGRALRAWVDLNRTRLYSELGLAPVYSTDQERDQNDRLQALIWGQDLFAAVLSPRPKR
jgi:hypothetical protein